MILRLMFFTVLILAASTSFAQRAVKEFAEECVAKLQNCESSVALQKEQIERYEVYREACKQEVELHNHAQESIKQAVDTCKETVVIREQQIDKLNKIESNLNQHAAQCLDGYTEAMKDYKSCVETSSFSLGRRKIFWFGLVLGVLIGVPIAI